MDNLTHSLFGWTLARAGLGRRVPYATATLVLASNAPDADVVVAVVAGGVEYLAAHRGPTHGPLGIVGLGLAVAGLVWAWDRWRAGGGSAADDEKAGRFVRWWLLAMAGIVGHLLMDLPTSYGTRVLSPFSETWFAFDWMPIIDVYLWAALIGSLVVGRMSGRRRQAALVGLALMLGDYAARAALHGRALAHGAAYDAAGVASPCTHAPTLVAHRGAIEAAATGGPACVAAAALPTFLSPATWRIVRQDAGGYEISERSVLARSPPFRSIRITTASGADVDRARATRTGEVYFDFARFPIARVSRTPTATTVRLLDVRFIGLPSTDDLSDTRAGLVYSVTLPPSPSAAGPRGAAGGP